jgi:PAS domain S-box-containing protein
MGRTGGLKSALAARVGRRARAAPAPPEHEGLRLVTAGRTAEAAEDLPLHHLQRLFALSLDLLIVVDRTGCIQSVSPSWQSVLGYRPEHLLGTAVADLVHPDDEQATRSARAAIARGEGVAQHENRYRHADGHYVWLRWTAAFDEDEGLVFGSARDVSAEREALAEADKAMQRMLDAQRVARVGSWEVDHVTGARFYTPEIYTIQALDPEADPWDVDALMASTVPEDHEAIRAGREQLAAHGAASFECRLREPADRVIRVILETVVEDGTPVLTRGTTQDITAMRENERRLAAAERVAGIGSFQWRVSDGQVTWSDGTYRLFHRDRSLPPLEQRDLEALALPEEVESSRRVLERFAQDGRPWELEFSTPDPRPDRSSRCRFKVRGEAFRVGDETFVRGTIQDVTRERRVARQQEELARLGQLALAGTDLKQLFYEICQVTVELLGTDVASVLALQDDGSLAVAAGYGFETERSGVVIDAGEDSVVSRALDADEAVVVRDWLEETRLPYFEALRAGGVRRTAVLPIRGAERAFGVLITHGRSPDQTDPAQDTAFLDALASFMATAIARQRHETEIASLAALRGRLVAENLSAEERERQRISEQLHDGALQDLLAARQDLVEAAAPGEPGMRDEMLGYARGGVERAVKLLREVVHVLHPVVLQHGGLEAAMQAATDQAARQGSFEAEVSVDPAAVGVRDQLVMSLARELLTNIAKHAEAVRVSVSLRREDDVLVLEVADDGRGLDATAVAAAPMNGHIGLASLVQRAEAVGGTLELQPGPDGRGTTALARLPLA